MGKVLFVCILIRIRYEKRYQQHCPAIIINAMKTIRKRIQNYSFISIDLLKTFPYVWRNVSSQYTAFAFDITLRNINCKVSDQNENSFGLLASISQCFKPSSISVKRTLTLHGTHNAKPLSDKRNIQYYLLANDEQFDVVDIARRESCY